MEEIDYSVFERDFDAHNRGRQCVRTVNGVNYPAAETAGVYEIPIKDEHRSSR